MLKVVVIDDSLPVQRSLGRLLESIPDVVVAGCAEDVTGALSLIESVAPDVVVLDVSLLHGEKGIDVLRYVKRQKPRMRVIALSSTASPQARAIYLNAGASAYFDKSSEFMQARDWVAGQRSGMSAPARDADST